MTDSNTQLFACLTYHDADRAIGFLRALGFTERIIVRDPDDQSVVVHSQFRWRETGGVMLGSVRPDDDREFTMTPGASTLNLVVSTDDEVDHTIERATSAGATLVQEPHHPPHGGRSAMVRDAEGNLWNIDSYPGE